VIEGQEKFAVDMAPEVPEVVEAPVEDEP